MKLAAMAAFAVVGPACRTADSPIRTALVDLTGESRTIEVYTTSWFERLFGPIAIHRQALSIGGLLSIPDVGQEFQWPGDRDVTTAVGIAVAQSYKLIGEIEAPGDGKPSVTDVRNALERVQDLAMQVSLVAAEVGILEQESQASERIHDLRSKRDRLEEKLASANEALRIAANTPGIVIARWSSQQAGGLGGDYAGIGGRWDAENTRSGFVILGGLRVVNLAFGEDFWWLINNLRNHEKPQIEQIGVSSNLIQAREVAYTSDLVVRQGLELALAQQQKTGDSLTSIRISGYWSFVGQFSNSGNLPRITWKREPFCFVCSIDLPGIAEAEDRVLQHLFGVENEEVDRRSYQHWRTISANITFLRDVGPWPFGFRWADHAEKYLEERQMWSVSPCQFCGTRAEPAVIKGVERFRPHEPMMEEH